MRPGEYHLLSAAEKRRVAVDRIREPDIVCPYCGTKTLVHDLVAHVELRCKGLAPIHNRASWTTRQSVLDMGLPSTTLERYVARGRIRTRQQGRKRLYLLRDVVSTIVLRSKAHGPLGGERARRVSKPLTKPARSRHKRRMANPLDVELRTRLKLYAETVGGYAPASRKLDISPDTIRRAATGLNIRQGTATLIEMQLKRVEKRR